MGKGNSPKVDDIKGHVTLGRSNWAIWSPLNGFCSKKVPPFYQPPIINQFFILQKERKEGRRRGRKWENGTLPKWMTPRGFWQLGIQTEPFAAFWTDFGGNATPARGILDKILPQGPPKSAQGLKTAKMGHSPESDFLLSSLFLCTNLLRESFLSTPPGIHGSTWGVLTPLLFMRHWMKRGNCPSLWLSNHQVDLVPLWPFFQLYPWNVARPPRILMRPWLRLPCLVHLDNGPL